MSAWSEIDNASALILNPAKNRTGQSGVQRLTCALLVPIRNYFLDEADRYVYHSTGNVPELNIGAFERL
jgi:hypothetical protein